MVQCASSSWRCRPQAPNAPHSGRAGRPPIDSKYLRQFPPRPLGVGPAPHSEGRGRDGRRAGRGTWAADQPFPPPSTSRTIGALSVHWMMFARSTPWGLTERADGERVHPTSWRAAGEVPPAGRSTGRVPRRRARHIAGSPSAQTTSGRSHGGTHEPPSGRAGLCEAHGQASIVRNVEVY